MPRNMGLSSPIIQICYGYLHITLMSQVNLQYTAGLTLPSENNIIPLRVKDCMEYCFSTEFRLGPFAASQLSAALCLSQN